MTTIFGALNVRDIDVFSDTAGQRAAWDAINTYFAATEEDSNRAYAVFVQGETTDYSERAFLPASGFMQRSRNTTRPGATKLAGSWDVAYPIDDMRDQIAIDDVALAYMTAAQMDANIQGVAQRYVNTKRYLILRALLNKSNETFSDDVRGDLVIRRLANADSGVEYPPVIGASGMTASHNHYIGTNYASSSISDTNNPYATIRDHIEEHYGDSQIVVFINPAERDKTEALTGFTDKTPSWVTPGSNTAVLVGNLPVVPGKIIGAISDVLVVEWRWIPSGYMVGVAVNQPGPLMRRLDLAESLRGFRLAAKQNEFPLEESFYRAREGYGARNRLNGVALQLVASTTYTTPSIYA